MFALALLAASALAEYTTIPMRIQPDLINEKLTFDKLNGWKLNKAFSSEVNIARICENFRFFNIPQLTNGASLTKQFPNTPAMMLLPSVVSSIFLESGALTSMLPSRSMIRKSLKPNLKLLVMRITHKQPAQLL
jgi:hypothetical protein